MDGYVEGFAHLSIGMVNAVGAPRNKKAEQSERSRYALIKAATELFAAHGYRDTSLAAIGDKAGVSRGSIGWHFGSKEGLLRAAVEEAFMRWELDELVPAVAEARGLEAISRTLHAHRQFLTGRHLAPRLFYVLLFEALGPRPELAVNFAELHRQLRANTLAWIQDAIDAGELRSDLDATATVTFIIGTLGGIAYQWLLDHHGVDLDRVYAELERTLVAGLRASP
ncbi:HTH-type transcriptional regulator MtrR [Mycobacterium kansasii]|jgi:AcrR family transcriptional regulator|nr:HTH-type transcriptional regulator MtrR [Mycobacterium kansasii]